MQGIGERELRFHVRHGYICDNGIVANGTAVELHGWVVPGTPMLLQTGTIVVVGGSAPELRRDALTVDEHGLSVNIKIVNHARIAANGERGAARR